ncbi:oxidoreductase [Emydomyces testavorans]|uniref:Oxidoreductase n=1 Tax=Emydomyces testavorans TaxID=2070801 RepID=A0AAF0DDJ6_9EURO|nr:oxidoreductase [Emydomyces testavorans]
MESDDEAPKYKYTKEDFLALVEETLVKDAKLYACLDKYFMGLVKTFGKKAFRSPEDYYPDRFPELKISDPGPVNSLKNELVTDIETLIPGYFDTFPSTASAQEKTEQFSEKLQEIYATWRDRQLPWVDVDEDDELDEFQKSLIRVLAQKQADSIGALKSGSKANDGVSSLHDSALTNLLKQLGSAVDGQQAIATFTCGGSIEVTREPELRKELGAPLRDSQAITIAWWPESGGNPRRIQLPAADGESSNGLSSLEQLVRDCSPAKFGCGDQDVLDLSYRDAGKLDAENFCCSFHPADFGILDTIEQMLLPSISTMQQNELEFRRVRAELYKLNVYSGPSGKFRKHVDTPRSPNHFGSLVVCLPSPHEGGALAVRHSGRDVVYDWSKFSECQIQWAAFYSDCEHEIHHVHKGHRITLTYNLFVTETIGAGLSPFPIVQPTSFPLYEQVKVLLDQRSFFTQGGVLGAFCSHSYAHTSGQSYWLFPRKLKGSDMALYAVLQSLGLPVKVRPVLEVDSEYFPKDPRLDVPASAVAECEGMRVRDEFQDYPLLDSERWEESQSFEYFRRTGKILSGDSSSANRQEIDFKLDYAHIPSSFYTYDDIHQRWKLRLLSMRPLGIGRIFAGTLVANDCHPYTAIDLGGDGELPQTVVEENWPHYCLPGITWITPPKAEKLALTHLCYGNEASLGERYTCAAIIAIIPPWHERHPAA